MTLQDCKPARLYKRPHWTDYYIKYNMPRMDWEYDNGSNVGDVVRQVDDLVECDLNGNILAQTPVNVKYTSDQPYDLILCMYPNSIKTYEFKILKGTPLEPDQPLITETAGKLSVTIFKKYITTTEYPEDKLSWIYGTITSLRNEKASIANDIVASIINEGVE